MGSQNPGEDPIVVAVDKDKNSSSAVKWAIDNLLGNNQILVLIHVRVKNSPKRRYLLSLSFTFLGLVCPNGEMAMN